MQSPKFQITIFKLNPALRNKVDIGLKWGFETTAKEGVLIWKKLTCWMVRKS